MEYTAQGTERGYWDVTYAEIGSAVGVADGAQVGGRDWGGRNGETAYSMGFRSFEVLIQANHAEIHLWIFALAGKVGSMSGIQVTLHSLHINLAWEGLH